MKKAIVNSFLIVLFLLASVSAEARTSKKSEVEKSKEVHKSYSLQSGQGLAINNRFGEVKITSWDKNQVEIHILVQVKTDSEEKSQELLDDIQFDFKEEKAFVEVSTQIGKANKGKVKISTKGKSSMNINYEVKMPINHPLKVNNSFGSLIIDKMNAAVSINARFGSCSIGELNSENNEVEFEFCDPVTIQSINKGKLTLKHSSLELLSSNELEFISEMSNSKIDEIKKLIIDQHFGSIELQKAGDIVLSSNMSSIKVGEVNKRGMFTPRYGSLSIGVIKSGTEMIVIDGEFSPIHVGLESGSVYQAEIETSMANLKLPKGISSSKEKNSMKSKYKGKIGSGSGREAVIKVHSSFGNVKIE
jgi:hypothetical protein